MNTIEFILNRSAHTAEELAPYIDHHVAWSLDGKQILAHGKDLDELLREVNRLGLRGGEFVGDYIPDPDSSLF